MSAFLEFIAYTEEKQPGKWAGYIIWSNGANNAETPDISYAFFTLVYYGPQQEAEKAIKILEDFANSSELYGFGAEFDIKENKSTWMDWHGPTTDPVGGNSVLTSRLIQTENIDTAETRKETVDAIL